MGGGNRLDGIDNDVADANDFNHSTLAPLEKFPADQIIPRTVLSGPPRR